MDDYKIDEMMKNARYMYMSWKKVYCPALNADVLFTRGGWNHLFVNKKRTKEEQLRRLDILPLSKKLLSMTTTIQEIRHKKGYSSFEFHAVMGTRGIGVVVSKSKGVFYFLSNYLL